jgi:hypothetical protein
VDISSSLLVSLVLACIAAGLMVWHLRVWRRAQRQDLDAREFEHQRLQFRRRMQTSALLGVLAGAIFVGSLITGPPVLVIVFWSGVLLVTCWVALLALADVLITRLHFSRLKADYLTEQAKLQAELRRIQSARSNGETKRGTPDS